MVPSINRVYVFVKVFRAYLAKSPFKTTKNLKRAKIANALEDDSGKLFYKKVDNRQTSNKKKKEIIEQVIGIENEVDVQTVYTKNLQKQGIQFKSYSGQKSFNATLVHPQQEVGKMSETSSKKAYSPEPTFKNVDEEESNRSDLLKIRSLFTLNPQSKRQNVTSASDKDINSLRDSQVNNSEAGDETLHSYQSVTECNEKKEYENTEGNTICKNNLNASYRKDKDINYGKETEINAKGNVDKKPDILQKYKHINKSPVLQPFLSSEKKKNIEEKTNQTITTIVESRENNDLKHYKHDTLEPYFRVRTFYKPLSNDFKFHAKPQRDKTMVNKETEIEQTDEYKPLSKPRYQYRVTVERTPASSPIIEESAIIPLSPLPPIIPTSNVVSTNVATNPMLAETKNIEEGPHSVSEISKNAELSEANEPREVNEPYKSDDKLNITETRRTEETAKTHHPNCPNHERFGFGDPYFHIRSYYRMRSQPRQEINYPVQSSTFIPSKTNELPEQDITPMQTPPNTKKRDPCDRLKKGYKDPPKRYYSTYCFHRTSSRPNPLFAVRLRSNSHIIQMNSPEGSRQRMISRKSASQVIIYDIGIF